jgi:hypothetical protein
MRTVGVPALDLWETVLGRKVVLEFHEDNETTILAMRNGYSPALRHIKRTHGVCLRWLCERFSGEGFKLYYERSARQAADIFTKSFTTLDDWLRNLRLIGHLLPEQFWNTAPVKVEGKLPEGSYWISNPWADAGNPATETAGECVKSCAAPLDTGKGTGFDWSCNDDDCGDYAWSVASDEEWEHEGLRSSPHVAAVVANRRFIPPLATEAHVEWERGELSSSPPVAAAVTEGRLIPPLIAEALQSVTIEESLSHPTVYSTTPITLGPVTRWESWKGRWRLRTRRPSTAAMASALAPLPPPTLRGILQGCGLLQGGGERRHTASKRAGLMPPRKGKHSLPRPPAG